MGLNCRRQGGDRGQILSPFVKAGVTAVVAGLLTGGGLTNAGLLGHVQLATPAYADWQPDNSNKTVDLDLADADLHAVVAVIQRQTGAQIVIQDGSHPYGHVTVQLQGASLSTVLRYIALSA